VLFRADREEERGAAAFTRFGVRGTPTTIILGPDGAEVDWIVSYNPPVEMFAAKIEKALSGTDTVKSLRAAVAANPQDAAAAFKLADKFRERALEDKAAPLFKQYLALDPYGRAGAIKPDYLRAPVGYVEWAEYQLAYFGLSARRDPAPLRAFLKKFPSGQMARLGYSSLKGLFYASAPAPEAFAFYEEYAAAFPADAYVFQSWLERIIEAKGPLDKGREVAARLETLTEYNPDAWVNATLARFYVMAGDPAKAEALFGPAFAESLSSNAAFGLLEFADYWAADAARREAVLAAAASAVKILPGNPNLLQRVAGIYLKLGDEAKALEVFGPAFAKAKENWDDTSPLRTYVWFWTKEGRNLLGALAAARHTVELRPRAYYLWSGLADVLAKMKDYPEALRAAEKAVEFASEASRPAQQKNLERIKAAAAVKK